MLFYLLMKCTLRKKLIYEKSTGALIGFADLGGVAQQLDEYEQMLSGNEAQARQIAKTMMVIMVRGVFNDICFPYAQFPMASPKGSDIFQLIWREIDRLECNDVKVLGVTCDGASVNRRFLKLHGNSLTYKTNNIYSDDNRSLLFFIDPSHLLKTIRNAVYNPSRHLWVCDVRIAKHLCIHASYITCLCSYVASMYFLFSAMASLSHGSLFEKFMNKIWEASLMLGFQWCINLQ